MPDHGLDGALDVVGARGPWTHSEVSANGIRLHVVEAGTGPLVLLLHGFPEFWWAWRHQLTALADAGLRVVASDLRGYGGTDKPPRGYDGFTLTGDIAGLVRALGERDAMLVGADWGGLLAWVAATAHPRVVRRLAVIGMPHPLRLRAALVGDAAQLRATRHAMTFQAPRYPESQLTRDDAAYVGRLLRDWSGPAWRRTADFAIACQRYRAAMQIPAVAHSALEYYRWMMRSQLRPDGYRFRKLMSTPVTVPTLQLHGADDPNILSRSAQGSGRYVAAPYQWRAIEGCGHFPAEEAPDVVSGELIGWAKSD
ncbi:MAG: alpha/beta fold hydrolase [Mycobacteriales bacterium]|nr:MAG: alpha/beta hydrolase [Pseudonocardiales bacterium]